MKVYCIYGIEYDSNVYLIPGEIPTIIDCGTGLHSKYIIDKVKEKIQLKKIKQIILTHEHFDHCGGVKDIFEKIGNHVKIIAHELSSHKIENGESDFARMLGSSMPKMPVDIKLKKDDKLKIGDNEFKVIHTPGHTPGCICLYNKENKILFSGDTIFAFGSFGRYDFPGGSLNELKDSIERITKLDIEKMYPGHESIVEKDANKHIKKSFENINCLY